MNCTPKKFPRIPHLPWSLGGTADDRRLSSVTSLLGRPLIITEKLDGANVCLTRKAVFARTHSGPPAHPAFDWLKARHAALRAQIPDDLSVFCEYTYAVHTIEYEGLPSYLFVIAVRREPDLCWISWEETVAVAERLGLPTVPLLLERKLWGKAAASMGSVRGSSCASRRALPTRSSPSPWRSG